MDAQPHFPGYLVEGLLGAGASTRVWKVRRGRGRFALKEFLGGGPILSELTNLTRLQHAHIVRCLDAGLSPEGGTFLVFELATGTLSERLKEGPLSGSEWLRLARHLLLALGVVHNDGVVHRDLKPQNILFFGSRRPSYKLADLGLACPFGQTRMGQAAHGTPAYMAPEQFEGSATPRSDLYALGLVLYQAGCGRQPFQGSYAELREQQQRRSPDFSHWPVVGQRRWLEKLLEKCPQARFASAELALQALVPRPRAEPIRPGSAEGGLPVEVSGPLGGEVLPVYRRWLEHCDGLHFLSRNGQLQLWASLPGLSLVLGRQGQHWSPLPAGPRLQACSASEPHWIADGADVWRLEPRLTRPRRVLHLPFPVEQLLATRSLLVVAGPRRLAAFSPDGVRRWATSLPHYWGPMPLATWGEHSLAVAVGPRPARLLRLRLEDGALEQEQDLPAPCLALHSEGHKVSLLLSELHPCDSAHTGCWQPGEHRLEQLTRLPGDVCWARSHARGFSVGRANRATLLLDPRGQLLARVPSRGQVACDGWSPDGRHYAWHEQHHGEGWLRLAELLPCLKEAC